MKIKKYLGLVSVLILLTLFSGVVASSVSATRSSPVPKAAASQPIIINHNNTDISKIPDYWLNEAKKLAFHYAHTSHGSQITSGLQALEESNAKYNYDRFTAHSSPPSSLDCDAGALCVYDGNPPETYISPDDYWEGSSGQDRTRAVADTELFDYSMWSWCGQASSYSETRIQDYLDAMSQFEKEYPNERFILMTGHTDGGSSTLARNNNMIRQYAIDNNMILFDFVDIETYDPLGGGPYDNNYEGNCTWCVDFCNVHPDYCTDLPAQCAHTDNHYEDKLFCKLKANAFWWMMARLAGWDGGLAIGGEAEKTASTSTAVHNQPITYTITISSIPTVTHMSDTLPASLAYVPGSLSATTGVVTDTTAALQWSGDLSGSPAEVTITYAATVNTAATQVITNTAVVTAPGYETISDAAAVLVNGRVVYLPLLVR